MKTFKDFANSLTDLIGNTVTDLLLTVAVAAFFWSVVTFIWNRSRGDVDAMKDASNRLLWSIIGLFVMFSIWGIVNFLQSGFGFENKNTIKAPTIQTNSSAATPSSGSLLKDNGQPCTASSQCKSGQCLAGRSGAMLCQG
jgi:hypothetical protein